MADSSARRVLLVDWEAADWHVARPLLQKGWMPHLQGLINRGAASNLRASPPLLTPTLSTSMLTGVPPMRHGILGWSEMREDGSGLRPVGRSARRMPAIWELLETAGIPTSVVNFPATHPAEHLSGISVSDQFADLTNPRDAADSVWPPSVRDEFATLRVAPTEIDAASLLSFVPKAKEIDTTRDPRLAILAQIISQTATMHAAATAALAKETWRFSAVCYSGIHQLSRAFMFYHPPRYEGITEREFELYQHVVTGAYRFHDMMLARLLELAGPQTLVLLVSTHGYQSNHHRRLLSPKTQSEFMSSCRSEGMMVLSAPGMQPATTLHEANLLDVAPTILGLFGFEAAPLMSGQVLKEAPVATPLRAINLQARLKSRVAENPTPHPSDPTDGEKSFIFLKSLGYVEQEDPYARVASENLETERQHIVALAWIEAGQPLEAARLLEHIVHLQPGSVEYQISLAQVCASTGNLDRFREITEKLSLMYPTSPIAAVGMGIAEMLSGNATKAVEWLQKAEGLGGIAPWLFAEMGRVYVRLQRQPEARAVFERAIAGDDQLAEAFAGLSIVQLKMGDLQAAVLSARRAVDLRPTTPANQYQLGLALLATDELSNARAALEAALSIDSESVEAMQALATACERQNDSARAGELHERLFRIQSRRRITPDLMFDMALRSRG